MKQLQAVPPDAGLWLRLGAKLIDQGLFTIPETACLCLGAYLNAVDRPAWIMAAGYALATAFWYIYVFEMTRRRGQTVGKMVAGIQVQTANGELPSARVVLRRLLVEFTFDMMGIIGMALAWALARAAGLPQPQAAVIGLGVGSVLALLNPLAILRTPRKQTIHDLLAGTYVLRVEPIRVGRLIAVAGLAQALSPALVFGVVRPFFVEAYVVPSGSMEPTIEIGDRILANKLVHRLRPPRRNEIIMFIAPEWVEPREKKVYVKRVVGIPGDRLEVRNGKLVRNGKPVSEPYIMASPGYEWPAEPGQVRVPPASVVVMGDNRNNSNDSHAWSGMSAARDRVEPKPFLPTDRIVGSLMFRFWPPDRFGKVTHEEVGAP